MIEPVPVELNLNNLRDIFARIRHLDAFVFFGTLLGYTREGNIIPHDDDIDIYVDIRQRRKLLRALKDSGFEVTQMPEKRRFFRKVVFVQAVRMQDGIKTYADFYLYSAKPRDHIIDVWNFRGVWFDRETDLHVPKELVFPLRTVEMQGIPISIPAEPEKLCEFLYGPGWRTPLRKEAQYKIEIADNRPQFVPIET